MMRLSPKLVKAPCTNHFSYRLSRRPLHCGLATAAETRSVNLFYRDENSKPLPVLIQDPIFRASCKSKTSASTPAFQSSSAGLPKWAPFCTNPVKALHLLSKGMHVLSIDDGLRHIQRFHTHTVSEPSVECASEEEVCSINGKEVGLKHSSCREFKAGRRFKYNPEVGRVRIRLNSCSKDADLHGALEVFDQVKREQQVRLDIHGYNILLYLCSGAASGKLLQDCRRKKEPLKSSVRNDETVGNGLEGQEGCNSSKVWVHFSQQEIELAANRGADILENMLEEGVEPNEATYTSIVRLAVAKNDGDLAFETIKLMESSGIPPKLRSYGPLLLSVCESNKADKAYEVDDHMSSLGIEPDETMLDGLLKVSTQAGREDKVYSLLHRLRNSLGELLPTTVQSVEKWFTSEHASFAGKARWKNLPSEEELRRATVACGGGFHGLGWLGAGAWQVRRTSISKMGSCLSCGERLCVIDLDTNDTEEFAKRVAKLACGSQKESPQFKMFQDWLERHGPFDAVIDGANVGYYNPRVYNGFNVSLLLALVKEVSARFCTRKPPLICLHVRHQHDIANCFNSDSILNKWKRDYGVYFTPLGANDDWFWLYAAVKCKCMLLSNDQMRDHNFALLGNNFFPKWKERHQVRFSFTSKSLEIHMPPPYSTIIQESQNGSWHVPQALQSVDDSAALREWLCVTRSGILSQE